jgi:hypothetical protein
MSLAFLFHYLMLNMFRVLIHPSSGACHLFVELFHGLYCSGSMCVGVRCGSAGVVWYPYAGWGSALACIRIPHHPSQTTTWHQHASYQKNTTHEITQQISCELLSMDVLTPETCWAINNEIKKQVTPSWSLFIQLKLEIFLLSIILLFPSLIRLITRGHYLNIKTSISRLDYNLKMATVVIAGFCVKFFDQPSVHGKHVCTMKFKENS